MKSIVTLIGALHGVRDGSGLKLNTGPTGRSIAPVMNKNAFISTYRRNAAPQRGKSVISLLYLLFHAKLRRKWRIKRMKPDVICTYEYEIV